MSWETELKLRVTAHDDVRRRLRDGGGVFQRHVVETNDIFDRPDGGLSGRGVGLRIRSVHPVEDAAVDSEVGPTILTVKGPRLPGVLKSREEIEFEVPNAETGARMLNLLGFVRVLRYEKRRESWGISDCFVELDEAPHIGRFVEIEGPDETSILAVRGELGLADTEAVADSYVRLMMNYCEAQGLRDRLVTFK
jgi:adenylate cyclase class 2